MMYQFLPSATASAAFVPPSSAGDSGVCSTASSVPFVGISSSISLSHSLGERVKQLVDQTQEDLVDHREIRREREHSDNHHDRGAANLLPGRPRHAAHLGLQLFKIILHRHGPARGSLEKTP